MTRHKVGDLVAFKTPYSSFFIMGIILEVEKKRYVKYTIQWFETDLFDNGGVRHAFNTKEVSKFKKYLTEVFNEL